MGLIVNIGNIIRQTVTARPRISAALTCEHRGTESEPLLDSRQPSSSRCQCGGSGSRSFSCSQPTKEAVMSAYIIVDIDIHDGAGLEEYRKQVPATIAKYGGRLHRPRGDVAKPGGARAPA